MQELERGMRRRRLSRVDLVGVEVVNKVLRQEHVLAVKVTKGVLEGRACSYLREPSSEFYMRETRLLGHSKPFA
jgi:hypothetical protein